MDNEEGLTPAREVSKAKIDRSLNVTGMADVGALTRSQFHASRRIHSRSSLSSRDISTMLSLVQWSSVAGFLFVLYRAVTLVNYPLLETDPKPRESHKWRLITAAYAPPLPSLTYSPN